MSNVLTAQQILAASDMDLERMECPEWGGHIFLRPWTGAERDRLEIESARIREENGGIEGLMALTVVMSARGEDGSLLFSIDQVDALQAKSAKPMGRIFDRQMALSGMSKQEAETLAGN